MESLESGGVATKDGGWRALELRQRVENRRQVTAGGAGVGFDATSSHQAPLSPSRDLTLTVPASPTSPASGSAGASSVSLPRLAQAKRESFDISMQILDMETRHYATLASCDRQFSAENAVRYVPECR